MLLLEKRSILFLLLISQEKLFYINCQKIAPGPRLLKLINFKLPLNHNKMQDKNVITTITLNEKVLGGDGKEKILHFWTKRSKPGVLENQKCCRYTKIQVSSWGNFAYDLYSITWCFFDLLNASKSQFIAYIIHIKGGC